MSNQSLPGVDGTVNCRSCWAHKHMRHTHTHSLVVHILQQMLPEG
ncbi:hypothetical protein ORF 127L [Red seabream iridovirus]|uniref:Uncharacterized protein n=3 Tax=Infectious spleen and kidney necrosis virus TaxID=180170 RepID=A0A3Q9EGC0_ISKNV|nr:hypothetical protein [Pompano iridovirus]QQA04046.1 hypothetical protein Geno-4000051 [Large yellow croaker iridovirus]WDW25986.1 hypothetical protein FD201807_053R [Megalocytivirus FD201807]BAK14235.1 hypothetical protein ORF 127L [Red seabream iridovirus]AZQ20914.1 hypothetical protein [Pompano iridovirus]